MKVGDSVKYLKYDSCEIVASTDNYVALRIPGGLVVNINKAVLEKKPAPPKPPVAPSKPAVAVKPPKKSKGN